MPDIKTADKLNKKYLRGDMWPTIFCNGCGHGVVLDYTFWAIEELGLDISEFINIISYFCSNPFY